MFYSLHKNVFWRGDVSFFDDSTKDFLDLSEFELSALDVGSLATLESLMNKNKRLISMQDKRINKSFVSRKIKIVSRCHLTTVPPFYLTKSRFSLRFVLFNRLSNRQKLNILMTIH
jgi:hypothetical protein